MRGSTVGGDTTSSTTASIPQARPQAIEPTAGQQAQAVTPNDPIGDPNAHPPPLSEVRHLLKLELIAVAANNATYIDPLRFVTVWERTDQGVDAQMPVGAPILAPCRVKILAVEPDWYAGQPLVYFELLEGPDAGKVQYVAEQITDIAPAGTILQQGQPVARYASRGTAIEYGWSTMNGITLARATTGYEEGEITPAGQYMRAMAEQPRRRRRALARRPERIAPARARRPSERAVGRVADQHRLGLLEPPIHLARLEERHQQARDRHALAPHDRGLSRRSALEVRRRDLARERRRHERRREGSGSGPSTAAPRYSTDGPSPDDHSSEEREARDQVLGSSRLRPRLLEQVRIADDLAAVRT